MTMNENTWDTAHLIAQTLVKNNTDANELGKALAYLRNAVNQNQSNAGSRFFQYLQTLTRNGRQIGHSGRTSDYYRNIDKACGDFLKPYQNDAGAMLEILGWSGRLMRYYKEGGAIGEITYSSNVISRVSQVNKVNQVNKVYQVNRESPQTTQQTERQREIAAVLDLQKFEVGQIIDATVSNIKGKEVTYELSEKIKLTVKEPKKVADLSTDKKVKVQVIDIRENGVPKKVKCID